MPSQLRVRSVSLTPLTSFGAALPPERQPREKFQEVKHLTTTRHPYDNHVERCVQVHFFLKKNVAERNRKNFKPCFCVFDFGFFGLPPDRAPADSDNFKKYLIRTFLLFGVKKFFPFGAARPHL